MDNQSQLHHFEKSLPPTFVPGWSDSKWSQVIPYQRLGGTDMLVSLLSYGTGHVSRDIIVGEGCRLIGADHVVQTIRDAVRLGINFIDTSPYYGKGVSELIVGEALKTIPRQAYYLSTKCGRLADCTFDYSRQWILKSVQQSLKKLNVQYLDVFIIHDVEFADMEIILNESLPTLGELRDQEKTIRYIGISGYPLSTLRKVVEQSAIKIDIVLTYCRYALWDTELENYFDFFKSKNIGLINAASFGMGLFSSEIPYWHPASKEIQQTCQQARNICQEQGISIFQLALRHALQESRIDTHLIGMENIEMVKQNIEIIIHGESNEKENRMLEFLLKEVFSKLTAKQNASNWENVEVERYRRNPEEFTKFLMQN